MPFKLKIKKKRQYNVVSKNILVICIELLDGSTVECTLSQESLGKECFDHVCQRALISQPQFFGLRYITKQNDSKWIDMDLPLKKQLDKYAASTTLHLRVMYYIISGVSLITDEMTRYHYFIHLKNDINEGRIVCDFNQAVLLASYSRQAEYGNHDSDTHNVDNLKRLLTFPKNLIESGQIEELTEAVLQQSSLLHNMSQATAEEYYIVTCQQLDGYGQETFAAQDESHKEVILGISVLGIVINSAYLSTTKWFRWTDISNVINNKRTFSIECSQGQKVISYQFNDVGSAKYIWRLCVLQHTFYVKYEQNTHFKSPENSRNMFTNCTEDPVITETQDKADSSISRLLRSGSNLNTSQSVQSASCLDLSMNQEPHRKRGLTPQYQVPSDSSAPKFMPMGMYGSQPEIPRQNRDINSQPNLVTPPVGNYYRDLQKYPDVTYHSSQRNIFESQIGNTGAVAMKRVSWRSQVDEKAYTSSDNYEADLRVNTPYDPCIDNLIHGVELLHLYKLPPPYPSRYCSNSTPDLASQRMNAPMNTFVTHVSGSSPDLVSSKSNANHQIYLNSCRQSVSNQQLQEPIYLPNAHGTYENLKMFSDNVNKCDKGYSSNYPMVNHIQNIQKVYDDRGNVIYCVPNNIDLIVKNQIKSAKASTMKFDHSGTYNQTGYAEVEPIYENIPLPFENDNNEIRNRAHSIQSAPGLMRFVDKKVNQSAFNEEDSPVAIIHPHPTNVVNSNAKTSNTMINDLNHTLCDLNLYDHALELNKMQNEHLNISKQNLNDVTNTIKDFREFCNFNTNVPSLNKIRSLIELPIAQNDAVKVTKAESFNNDMLPKYPDSSTLSRPRLSLIGKNKYLHRSTSHIECGNANLLEAQTLNAPYGSSYFDDKNRTESTSNANPTKVKKKRRWGILGTHTKSSEKIKISQSAGSLSWIGFAFFRFSLQLGFSAE